MKKLSTEEKAKAYDDAFKEASIAHKDEDRHLKATLERIFPELKESEGEKVRKTLVDYFKTYKEQEECGIKTFYGIPTDSIIAWLEKQGKNNIGISEATKQELEDNLNKALEKETPESWNKFLDEQKPADKVEPKFKVGDWVVSDDKDVHDDYRVCKITKIVDGRYYIEGGDFLSESSLALYGYRLWTIQDAKDGDVLYECNEKKPFIFKELKTKHIDDIASYCDIFNGVFNPNEDNWTTLDIVPATKEQRNLLFQEMKEAGYEWDAEKLELKKVEQKPAWSEEDEKLVKNLISTLSNLYARNLIEKETKEKYTNWLKSIRPQPKQEWSKEDEKFVHGLIRGLAAKRDIHGHTTFSSDCIDITETINWLKSLRPQSQWKPSESDILLLERITNGMYNPKDFQVSLCGLIGQLKKLREE